LFEILPRAIADAVKGNVEVAVIHAPIYVDEHAEGEHVYGVRPAIECGIIYRKLEGIEWEIDALVSPSGSVFFTRIEDTLASVKQHIEKHGVKPAITIELTDEGKDRAIIERGDLSVRPRIRIELLIAHKTIQTLVAAGFKLQADNGEERTKWGATEPELIDNLFACDESHLYACKIGTGRTSFVFFVLGNDGYDVINDYGTSLEPQMAEVNAFAERFEAHEPHARCNCEACEAADRETLDNAPYDQPLNDKEQAALDRERLREENRKRGS
jgi:hypothetical protein